MTDDEFTARVLRHVAECAGLTYEELTSGRGKPEIEELPARLALVPEGAIGRTPEGRWVYSAEWLKQRLREDIEGSPAQ